jgi:putative membrane protein
MKLILRILINAIAVWVTTLILPGITFSGGIIELLVVAIIFGLVNALIRPIFKLLTLPINIATLGLFTLVINALMLWLTAWISGALTVGGGLVAGFINALLGSLLISIVSTILSWLLPED